jgi:endoglucanase
MKPKKIKWLFLSNFILMAVFLMFSCRKEKERPQLIYKPPIAVVVDSSSAVIIMNKMGVGFNLGNTFDRVQHSTNPTTIYPIIDLYYNAGLRHIRIPTTWMDGFSNNTLADANGNLNTSHPRFVQLKQVIDYALTKKDMYVIINTHHEYRLKNNYDGSDNMDKMFSNLWTGIANHFKSYPNKLIFEILNEPEGKFGHFSNAPGTINPRLAEPTRLTRRINRIGFEAIRSTGGENAHRIIMIAPNGRGNIYELKYVYPSREFLPGGGKDIYLAAQVHTYDPINFCLENGSNANYSPVNVNTLIVGLVKHAKDNLGIPVNYGEFGVGRITATEAERNSDVVRDYYRTMVTAIRKENMSATVWDDRGWFKLVSVNNNIPTFTFDIVPSFMRK